MGCFLFASKKAPVKEHGRVGGDLVTGSATCRRVSLDPYQQPPRKPAAPAAAQGPRRANSGAGAGASASVSVTGPARGRAASAPTKAGDGPRRSGEDYIEVNPLRRMSLPMAGQDSRPVNTLRRGSMPTAILTMPTAQAP